MSDVPPPKPWSVNQFETFRDHLTKFCKEKIIPYVANRRVRRILIHAPVKSGKREIVEYLAMRDLCGEPKRKHVFISPWHRTADEEQREELRKQNMVVFSIISKKHAEACIRWILEQLSDGYEIVAHLDEADHGSGELQILCSVWKVLQSNKDITCILYTATPPEILFSKAMEDPEFQGVLDDMFKESHHVRYEPPEEFCGPEKFLMEGLVHTALPFFCKKSDGKCALTDQGHEIIRRLRNDIAINPKRNLLALRLSYSLRGGKGRKKEDKAIYQFLQNLLSILGLAGAIVIVDKDDVKTARYPGVLVQRIDWSNRVYWDALVTGTPVIIVYDQTSSRSTEWACHDRMHTTHDFRNKICFSTISQAQERVNHYPAKYEGKFQPIIVYGNKKTFELSADMLGYRTYLENDWEKRKVYKSDPARYIVKNVETGENHPDCGEAGLSDDDAEHLLYALECFDTTLSARVVGSDREVPNHKVRFVPCNPETWADLPEDIRQGGKNPFTEQALANRKDNLDGSFTWRGYNYGWKVLHHMDGDYLITTEIDKSNARRGALGGGNTRKTICYKDGVLGIAVMYTEGTIQRKPLRTSGSMYGAAAE
jgi:hypothetical protein